MPQQNFYITTIAITLVFTSLLVANQSFAKETPGGNHPTPNANITSTRSGGDSSTRLGVDSGDSSSRLGKEPGDSSTQLGVTTGDSSTRLGIDSGDSSTRLETGRSSSDSDNSNDNRQVR